MLLRLEFQTDPATGWRSCSNCQRLVIRESQDPVMIQFQRSRIPRSVDHAGFYSRNALSQIRQDQPEHLRRVDANPSLVFQGVAH